MDTAWSANEWKPTVDADSVVYKRPSLLVRTPPPPFIFSYVFSERLIKRQEVQLLQINLQDLSQWLRRCPYNPLAWLQRAELLLELGFPELAVGDAYKALLLIGKSQNSQDRLATCINNHLDISVLSSMTKAELQRSLPEQNAVLALIQALLLANCLQESLDHAQQAVAKYPEHLNLRTMLNTVQRAYDNDRLESETDDNLKGMDALEEEEYRRSGHVLLQSYPWMDPDLFSRRRDIIPSVQKQFLVASWGQCKLERSSVRDGISTEDRSEKFSEVFGVMATEDLAGNGLILVDHTSLAAVENPTNRCSCCCCALTSKFSTLKCCSTRFCSSFCADSARANYHSAVCRKDFSRFETACRTKSATPERATDEMLFLRVLAVAVQHSSMHPLDSPFLKQLTAMYDGKKHQPFDCKKNIIGAFEMLMCLGVDIFANPNFDTWVLQTLRARVENNAREYSVNGHAHIAISPLYSFFNHSCDPNATWKDDNATQSSTVRVYTLRKVSEGEELFINYHEELSDKPYLERRKVLRQWLGFDCQCARCVQEEAADQSSQRIRLTEVLSLPCK